MSKRVVAYFADLVTPTTPAGRALRDSLHLSHVRRSQISLVRDDHTCGRALMAMAGLLTGKEQTRGEKSSTRNERDDAKGKEPAVYVVRVGAMYGVVDTTWHAGEWIPAVVFTKQWKLRRILLAF